MRKLLFGVRVVVRLAVFTLLVYRQAFSSAGEAPFRRLVILKVDGLNADLLYSQMQQVDPATGKSRLPWLSHIFEENGVTFDNFYVRGISLSAPSWSMLDTGQHAVIRGNVEYDRYTGQVYDYLNFFPFYIGYARKRLVDMPGVEVLDRAGLPLMIDRFQNGQLVQSFQLFQREVRWKTLSDALIHGFAGTTLTSLFENAGPSLSPAVATESETLLETSLARPEVLYLDLFVGDIDHEGHRTNTPASMLDALHNLDALAGRIWRAIESNRLADKTLFVAVSDHGMNNVPGVISQTFSLPDLLNTVEGGAHHVITDREQLSDFKLKAIDPLIHRVVTPSTVSLYLKNRSSEYPTAWLDLDGNEQASIHLRNSDLNKIHILLLQLSRADLNPVLRCAIAREIRLTIDCHRARWTQAVDELNTELQALEQAIAERKILLKRLPKRSQEDGSETAGRRMRAELDTWESEHEGYRKYCTHLASLLSFDPDETRAFAGKISDLIPEGALADNNSVGDLMHYVVGPSPAGMTLDAYGKLDQTKSFLFVNYFSLLAGQVAKNNPQPQLSSHPIDFSAAALPDAEYAPERPGAQHAYLLYREDNNELVILQDTSEHLRLLPASDLTQDPSGKVTWTAQCWKPGLPFELFEDPALQLAAGMDREQWLSGWHSEREWLAAIHKCKYSNGVIGVTEELRSVEPLVPGRPGITPTFRLYEQKRRELVRPDFHVFAADHWNFNVRFPNPGGNHGGFLRISTHSVWMMAGPGLHRTHVEQPYDSLNFASTVLSLLGKTPPMPDRVVDLN